MVLGFLAEQFFPWWSVTICAFVVALVVQKKILLSFVSGFLSVGLLWFTWALYMDNSTDSILSSKIAVLLDVDSALILVGITGLIGALVGSFAAVTGTSLMSLLSSK